MLITIIVVVVVIVVIVAIVTIDRDYSNRRNDNEPFQTLNYAISVRALSQVHQQGPLLNQVLPAALMPCLRDQQEILQPSTPHTGILSGDSRDPFRIPVYTRGGYRPISKVESAFCYQRRAFSY